MNKNNIFIYSLATQHENLGDLLINQQLIRWLSKIAVVVIEEKGVPQEFLYAVGGANVIKASCDPQKYSVKTLGFYLTSLVRRLAINAVVLSPGHMGGSSIKANVKRILVLLVSAYLRMRGVHTIRVGVSFGNIDFAGRLIESLSVLAFRVYCVRDENSRKKLLVFSRKECLVVPDLSFLAFEQLNSKANHGGVKDKVVFSVRGDRRYPKVNKSYEVAIYNDIPLQAAKEFSEVLCYSQVAFDVKEQRLLKSYLELNGVSARVAEEFESIDKAANLLSDAKIVISNRLHVLLPAMMLETLAVCVGDPVVDEKIFSIYQDMGLDDLIYDIENRTESFEEFMQALLLNREDIIERMNIAVQIQVNEIVALMDSIVK